MQSKRIVITGLGAITPIGLSVSEYWDGLVNGKCGIGPITHFDTTAYPTKLAAEVKGFEPTNYMHIKRADRTSLASQFGIAAARMALTSAGIDMSKENAERVGVVIATSGMISLICQQWDIMKAKGPMRIDPLFINKIAASMVPSQVGLEVGAKGPNTSINSACASGSDALGAALNLMRLGHADVIIAGGAESSISQVSIASLSKVGALPKETDPRKACRPFDLNRTGMIFGEGAGILILETCEHAASRGAHILAELAGAGWSFDAFNETAPSAETQAVAMKSALRDALISPDEVDYINAHGTATKLNDSAETAATKKVFGSRAYSIPMSSNKSMIGHLACAAGAVEAVAAVMTINTGILPPTIAYETPDPECDLDYVPNVARRKPVSVCMSNSFGMGGQNCCIVLRRYE
ncbi:MAG: beta-ketoacyl-ACP synthase II [Chloroflexi bacterium]|nr:beta-ketoacyl-ACP synthase II [Chloroflexota bacterium]